MVFENEAQMLAFRLLIMFMFIPTTVILYINPCENALILETIDMAKHQLNYRSAQTPRGY